MMPLDFTRLIKSFEISTFARSDEGFFILRSLSFEERDRKGVA